MPSRANILRSIPVGGDYQTPYVDERNYSSWKAAGYRMRTEEGRHIQIKRLGDMIHAHRYASTEDMHLRCRYRWGKKEVLLDMGLDDVVLMPPTSEQDLRNWRSVASVLSRDLDCIWSIRRCEDGFTITRHDKKERSAHLLRREIDRMAELKRLRRFFPEENEAVEASQMDKANIDPSSFLKGVEWARKTIFGE